MGILGLKKALIMTGICIFGTSCWYFLTGKKNKQAKEAQEAKREAEFLQDNETLTDAPSATVENTKNDTVPFTLPFKSPKLISGTPGDIHAYLDDERVLYPILTYLPKSSHVDQPKKIQKIPVDKQELDSSEREISNVDLSVNNAPTKPVGRAQSPEKTLIADVISKSESDVTSASHDNALGVKSSEVSAIESHTSESKSELFAEKDDESVFNQYKASSDRDDSAIGMSPCYSRTSTTSSIAERPQSGDGKWNVTAAEFVPAQTMSATAASEMVFEYDQLASNYYMQYYAMTGQYPAQTLDQTHLDTSLPKGFYSPDKNKKIGARSSSSKAPRAKNTPKPASRPTDSEGSRSRRRPNKKGKDGKGRFSPNDTVTRGLVLEDFLKVEQKDAFSSTNAKEVAIEPPKALVDDSRVGKGKTDDSAKLIPPPADLGNISLSGKISYAAVSATAPSKPPSTHRKTVEAKIVETKATETDQMESKPLDEIKLSQGSSESDKKPLWSSIISQSS